MNKSIKYVSLLVLAFLFLSIKDTYAQRRVVIKRPAKTVVVTKVPRKKNVYVNRIQPRPAIVINTLPARRLRVFHRGVAYYYFAGAFYKPHTGGFILVQPPPGMVIPALPGNYVRIELHQSTFFYFGGVFYKESGEAFEVTAPPAGAQVNTLPDEADKVSIDGKIYYDHHGTLYKKVETINGFAYEVSGNIEG